MLFLHKQINIQTMKTGLKFISLSLLLITIISCKGNVNRDDYLRKVLNKLEKIESATYHERSESWLPGDTTARSDFNRFVKEYNNPKDTTIGASYVVLNCEDTKKLEFCYDGNMRVLVYHDVKGMVIDDFTTPRFPFRLVSPPFFNYTKNIIRYALNTEDSINVELKDLGEDYYFKLVINEDAQIEFFGKAYHMPENPYIFGETTSIYELWIKKSNDLPYKVRREMAHDISVNTCSDVEINKLAIKDFNAYDYFPSDYEIRKYGEARKPSTPDLIGKKAPDWILNDMNEQAVSLTDFKSKVLLINFTGIGCGPCHASIPFLTKLKDDFSVEDFEIASIETWTRKPHSLKFYANKNNLNYKFLSATDDVIKQYRTGGAAPVFFILDEQRIIRKVITGYGKESTDKEIMSAIKELL